MQLGYINNYWNIFNNAPSNSYSKFIMTGGRTARVALGQNKYTSKVGTSLESYLFDGLQWTKYFGKLAFYIKTSRQNQHQIIMVKLISDKSYWL